MQGVALVDHTGMKDEEKDFIAWESGANGMLDRYRSGDILPFALGVLLVLLPAIARAERGVEITPFTCGAAP